MQLYKIAQEIAEVEKEMMIYASENEGDITGFELSDRLEQLEMDKEDKSLSIGLHIQNMAAEANMIKAEKLKLAERQSSMEKKVERWTGYLSVYLDKGETFKNATTEIKWSKSEKVELDEDLMNIMEIDSKFVKTSRSFIRPEIKKAVKAGEIDWATIVKTQTLKVK